MCEPYGDSRVSCRGHTCGGYALETGMRARIAHTVWSNVSGGWQAWLFNRCSNKDAGISERKTPTLCENAKGSDTRRIVFVEVQGCIGAPNDTHVVPELFSWDVATY